MRILAIRGKNLASLQGAFEIRLDEPPLSSFGLFSISGPTGAGKSTLLDALCLALYGKTPRLRGEGGHVIGGHGTDLEDCLKSNDVRAILTRGAAEGYAEAEFQGVDGRRYRARWEVRRARGQAHGRLQSQAMAIRALDTGEVMAAQLAATRAQVERLVGFTFDEFRRTVLLPQFEFTNFLRAKADERASILEHIAGGEIFTRLSMAAHERASGEQAKLKELNDRMAKTVVLSDDEHAALATRLADAEARRTAAQEQVSHLEGYLRWHHEQAQWTSRLAEARQAIAEAEERLARAQPLEQELVAVLACQGLRHLHREAASAADERERRYAVALAARRELEQASATAQATVLAAQAKAAGFQAAQAREQELRPRIEEARRLDQEGHGARKQVAEHAGKLAEAEGSLAEAQAAREQAEQSAAAIAEEIRAQERWQAEHRAEQALADEWSRWQADLIRHGDVVSRRAEVAAAMDAEGRKLEQARAAHAAAEAQIDEKLAVLQNAQAALAEVAGGAATQELAEASRHAGTCRDALTALTALSETCGRSQQLAASRSLHQTAHDDGVARRDLLLEHIRACRDELGLCKARLSEARTVLEGTRAALNLAEHRAALRHGEPCPLCGSREHPWAKDGAPDVLTPARQRVSELEQRESMLARELQAMEREHAAAEHAVAIAQGRLAEDTDAVAQAQRDYVARRAAFAALPERALDATTPVAVLLAGAQTALAQAAAVEAARLAAITRRDAAQHAFEAARQQHDDAVAERHRRQAQLAEQEALVRQLAENHRRLVAERDDIERGLGPALDWLPRWSDEARQAPTAFTAELARKVAQFKEQQGKLDQARTALADCQARRATAAALVTEREQLQNRMAEDHRVLCATLDEILARRRAILGGRETSLVAQETAALLEEAERERDTARDEARRAETTALSLATAARAAAVSLAEQEERAAAAEQSLVEALAKLGIDRPTLVARLTRGEAWIEDTRATLERLRGDVATARATRDERQQRVAELASQGVPPLDLGACQTAHAEARAVVASAELEVTELKAHLKLDESQRTLRRACEAEAQAQEERSQVWAQLDDVIGSSDGKKLRIFAQGLAFRALVREANAHLADLAPRYHLRSVPSADLEMQVADQDLGGELRSINSLSGGETFLVALALALGLSALSTRATQAQTLFIDEGFGTLDRDSLDHAIVALENLQATGRTVGIISHIPELHERFGAQVRVERVGVGRSRVVVTT